MYTFGTALIPCHQYATVPVADRKNFEKKPRLIHAGLSMRGNRTPRHRHGPHQRVERLNLRVGKGAVKDLPGGLPLDLAVD